MSQGLFFLMGADVLRNENEVSDASNVKTVLNVLAITPLVMLFSYVFGGLQAAATGAIIVLFARKDGGFGYSLAIIASIVPSIIGAAIFAQGSIGIGLFLVVVGVLASFVLRFTLRKSFEKTVSAQNDT